MSKKPNDTKSAQIDRFKEAARQLGVDEDEVVFDEKLRKIVPQKPVKVSEK